MRTRRSATPFACVLGDMELVRPLGLAGIRSLVVAVPGNPAIWSRFTREALHWDGSGGEEGLVDALIRLGTAQPEPPVLFYQEDWQLLLVSRHRDRLAKAFRFVIPEARLVEDLVDKGRFQALAERLGLPVPATRRVRLAADPTPPDPGLRFPVIVKPLLRDEQWGAAGNVGKALQADSPAELRALWPRLATAATDLLVQEMVPGPETRIESYHVYVDEQGGIAGEFTGRKIRTFPLSLGYSTALEISDAADVAALGRDLVRRLGLTGVAKFDFKRAPDGTLHLLEVNPRFNLWHHLGAVAGVNLPALVHADLTGRPRPVMAARARAGTSWCRLDQDWRAAEASGLSWLSWLSWALRCEAKLNMSWDDPMPYLRGVAWPYLRGRLSRRLRRHFPRQAARPRAPTAKA
ncbi:MAG: ATP-grasp domain-containing protein [Acetobacteraceae bacterium]|nr:ATP-grasp domain-containing protein [Acetobacteraceae bacterium]